MILEIMIETVNRSDMHEKIVGFAYFPLFLGLDAINSPHSPEVDKFIFNEGAYQIPIFANRIAEGVDLTLQKIADLAKISCATMCVRSHPCPQYNNKNLNLDDNRNLTPG